MHRAALPVAEFVRFHGGVAGVFANDLVHAARLILAAAVFAGGYPGVMLASLG